MFPPFERVKTHDPTWTLPARAAGPSDDGRRSFRGERRAVIERRWLVFVIGELENEATHGSETSSGGWMKKL
jgi:hypothetical protein